MELWHYLLVTMDQQVLILIIMEDTHGVNTLSEGMVFQTYGLNPYYNGRYSWRVSFLFIRLLQVVLILIIMEDTHGVIFAKLLQIVSKS